MSSGGGSPVGSIGDKRIQNMMRVYSLRHAGLARFVRSIGRSDVVVLHGYYLWWIPLAVLAAKSTSSTVLLTPHGSLTSYQEGHSRFKKAVFKAFVSSWMDRLVDRFVTGSEVEAEMLRASGRSRVSVAGVGTVLPATGDLAQGAISDPIELVSVSRIAPKKRIDTMIRAVHALTLSGENVRLRVAGDGSEELRVSLSKLAQQLHVEDRVQFVGQLEGPEKTALFREADIFLLPSDDENFGIGLAEALAHAVPCVVTAAVGASEKMTADAGRIIPRSDPALVAQAVVELAALDEFQAARDSARLVAEQAFGWDEVARNWMAVTSLAHK